MVVVGGPTPGSASDERARKNPTQPEEVNSNKKQLLTVVSTKDALGLGLCHSVGLGIFGYESRVVRGRIKDRAPDYRQKMKHLQVTKPSLPPFCTAVIAAVIVFLALHHFCFHSNRFVTRYQSRNLCS